MGTLEALQSILVEELKLDPARLVPEARLEELGIDSLALLELMFKIEDRYNLKIKDDIPRSMHTVGDLVAFIDGLLAQGAADPLVSPGTGPS
jgi:acyl carrier protein